MPATITDPHSSTPHSRVLHNLVWPQTLYVARDDTELLIFKSRSVEFWDHKHVAAHLAYTMLLLGSILGDTCYDDYFQRGDNVCQVAGFAM